MRVTRFQYPLEVRLLKKLELMIARCIQKNPKRDAVLLIEGAEGEGKTSAAVALGYYIGERSKRYFGAECVFSDITKMINYLQEKDGRIAVWDEPALQALSGDSLSTIVKDLKRMLMMCRCKRHFIIINMTYFSEFGNYIVWQRPLGMIHVYSRNELQPGRFIYVKKRKLERLWLDWKTKKQRNYMKYGSKGVRGCFPDVMNPRYKYNVLSEFDFELYEKNKNDAIMNIGKEKDSKRDPRSIHKEVCMKFIKNTKELGIYLSEEQLSKILMVNKRTIGRFTRELRLLTQDSGQLINNSGGGEQQTSIRVTEQEIVLPHQHPPQIIGSKYGYY